MELLPVIYNSLIIAAGLFVITVAVSYISYKLKQKNGNDEESATPANSHKHIQKSKPTELKPKYKSPPPVKKEKPNRKDKPVPEKKIEKKRPVEKKVKESPRQRETEPEKKRKKDLRGHETRIEIVKDLSKPSGRAGEEPEPPKQEKKETKKKSAGGKENGKK